MSKRRNRLLQHATTAIASGALSLAFGLKTLEKGIEYDSYAYSGVVKKENTSKRFESSLAMLGYGALSGVFALGAGVSGRRTKRLWVDRKQWSGSRAKLDTSDPARFLTEDSSVDNG